MQLRHIIILLTFGSLYSACKDTNLPEQPESETTTLVEESATEVVEQLPTYVYPWVDQLRIRSTPNAKGTVLAKLKEGEPLKYLGEETMEETEVTLRGKTIKAPWIKVQTENEITGWIFGGAITSKAPARDMSFTPYDDCYRQKNQRWQRDRNCVSKVASRQLRSDKQFVQKRDDAILITLLDGTFKVFDKKDTDTPTELIAYQYMFYLKEMGFFVLRRDFGGRFDYLLVNDKSGKGTALNGLPKASPNRDYLITLNNQPENTQIEIWQLSNDGLTLNWQKTLTEEQAFRPQWFDNSSIQVITQFTNRPQKAADTSLIQRSAAGEWEYEDKTAAEL